MGLCACNTDNLDKNNGNYYINPSSTSPEPATFPSETVADNNAVTMAPTAAPTQPSTNQPATSATKAPANNSTEGASALPALPDVTVTSDDITTFSGLSYYNPEKIVTYVAYKQLHPELSKEDVVTHVNIGLHTPFYSSVKTISDPNNLLVLCNKYNTLTADYKPFDLTLMNVKYASSGQYMRKEAVEAFYKLSDAAKAAGHTIIAVSTYRSYDYQSKLYNSYVASKGQAQADLSSAKAGTSEHQTGLAVDVTAGAIADYTKFGETPSYQWAKENIHNYGFIIRYPENKTNITGYKTEPWHFRYVGVETAKLVYESGLTYDEYYVRYIAK